MSENPQIFCESPEMHVDPLTEVVSLLQPTARFSKMVEGAGSWRLHRQDAGEPFYFAILQGSCSASVNGQPPIDLQEGDFLLVPEMYDLVNVSAEPAVAATFSTPVQLAEGLFRIGRQTGPAEMRGLVGHCAFRAPDAALLVPLLPQTMLVRGEKRLALLAQMVGEETRAQRPAREMVLERLLEVVLIEALRCGAGTDAAPGLARGLADDRLAAALRALHARPAHAWTVAELAAEAALSRSAFFARFSRTVGVAPMEYLLAWRMALAKRLLRRQELAVEQVATRVGYGSASTFSTAFARHVGLPPMRFARMAQPA
jgi:AraC-like DNA-binding protein